MSDLIALIDLDGTLCDYDLAVREGMAALAGPLDPPFEGFDSNRPAYLEARRKLISRQPGFWRNLPRIERGFEVVELLRKLDFQLQVLTKGPTSNSQAWSEKIDWCRVNIPDAKLAIVEDKSIVYGRILVDDWPEYYESWLAMRPNGLVVNVAQPWNQGSMAKHPNHCFRYEDHVELDLLEEIFRSVKYRPAGSQIPLRAIINSYTGIL